MCVCVCVHACALLLGVRDSLGDGAWMLKCLNFQYTSIFSIHRGIVYVKSILFWKFVMSSYYTSASDLVSLSLVLMSLSFPKIPY